MSQTLPAPKRHDRPAIRAVVRYRTVNVGRIKIFYREVGKQEAPALLLLHVIGRVRAVLIHADGHPLTYWQGAYRLISQQQIQPKEEDEEVYE
jgi:hypothetical protein